MSGRRCQHCLALGVSVDPHRSVRSPTGVGMTKDVSCPATDWNVGADRKASARCASASYWRPRRPHSRHRSPYARTAVVR